ncbi:Retrotransposon protein [Nesidiocoris tenuis]|uniref:Retrotransposon protein n=1 Tax=Nesidiocoris tenuis TaxID=355587 RepID=A0ABN7ACJ8_9HEMI|nr:Retrotransposon protein [Nesidiocoris tenuis]
MTDSNSTQFKLPCLVFDGTLAQKLPSWRKMFELNMKASGKSKSKDEEMKIAILLTHMGIASIDGYNTFPSNKNTLDEVLTLFDEYCVPAANYAIETFKFNKIAHDPSKSFDFYLTDLKTQAGKCNFVYAKEECKASNTDRMIRDHIVANTKTVVITLPVLL